MIEIKFAKHKKKREVKLAQQKTRDIKLSHKNHMRDKIN